MVDLTDAELHEALSEASERASLSAEGARIIHHYSNAVFLLPAEDAVARMTPESRSVAQIGTTQQVVRWLCDDHGFGATSPIAGTTPTVVRPRQGAPGLTVSFWHYYPQPDPAEAFDSAHLGSLLRDLHALTEPPLALPRWRPLTSLRNVLTSEGPYEGLSSAEREWLLEEVASVTERVDRYDWPLGTGLIHADAWAGNLLWDVTASAGQRAILGDWDGVSIGPREMDLIPTWHAATRYGRDKAWIERFVDTYGYDLSEEPGLDLLMRMRDLVQLSGPLRRANRSAAHRAALRERFDAIRAGDTAMTWTGL
ncbi:phosphotransferase [Nocardioides sp. YIM B13467]|uniref:phosphotransferase n=1 Tax=Nocardioides sp. YIM B13467 TaxID=3366294 RepID=UPI00367357BA